MSNDNNITNGNNSEQQASDNYLDVTKKWQHALKVVDMAFALHCPWWHHPPMTAAK